jgi:hypothetical protein
MRAMWEIDVFLGFPTPDRAAGIGKPLRRREDVSFLTGAGRYADDMSLFRLVRENSGGLEGSQAFIRDWRRFSSSDHRSFRSSRRAPRLSAPSPGNFWFLAPGTEISNPFPSSAESATNLEGRRHLVELDRPPELFRGRPHAGRCGAGGGWQRTAFLGEFSASSALGLISVVP